MAQVAGVTACGGARGAALGNTGDTRELTTDDDSTGRDDVTVMEVTIGPELLDCVGAGPRKCLKVDGQLFYEGIDGSSTRRATPIG